MYLLTRFEDFLQPPYEALIQEDELFKNWSHEKKGYV
jgi:hypothetical protein